MDEIQLTGLRAFGHHGVFEHERTNGQDFFIDVRMQLDLRPAALSDDVADTVHYGEVADLVVANVESSPVALIETVAQRLADAVLDGYALVQSVSITVHKPSAPIVPPFQDVAVTVHRKRE